MVREDGDRSCRRLLVIADETSAAPQLLAEVRRHAVWAEEIVIVAPALNSRLRHWLSDTDRAVAEAAARLELALAALGDLGLPVRGSVGDADPLQALDDAMRELAIEQVLISTHAPGKSNWLERGVVERARARYGLPIGHVAAAPAASRAA
jgi:hypothetical protein